MAMGAMVVVAAAACASTGVSMAASAIDDQDRGQDEGLR